jgi:hypothetical protein
MIHMIVSIGGNLLLCGEEGGPATLMTPQPHLPAG